MHSISCGAHLQHRGCALRARHGAHRRWRVCEEPASEENDGKQQQIMKAVIAAKIVSNESNNDVSGENQANDAHCWRATRVRGTRARSMLHARAFARAHRLNIIACAASGASRSISAMARRARALCYRAPSTRTRTARGTRTHCHASSSCAQHFARRLSISIDAVAAWRQKNSNGGSNEENVKSGGIEDRRT